jgi:hypothetical protein
MAAETEETATAAPTTEIETEAAAGTMMTEGTEVGTATMTAGTETAGEETGTMTVAEVDHALPLAVAAAEARSLYCIFLIVL